MPLRFRRSLLGALCLAILSLPACSPPPAAPVAVGASPKLAWAYPTGPQQAFDPSVPQGVIPVGSTVRPPPGPHGMIDWFPDEHPPVPPIVGTGRKGGASPCAECHLYDGHGFLGGADLAGLPAAYIVEQVMAFRSGARRSAQLPDRFDTTEMIKELRQVTDTDLATAAAWFAALPRHRFVHVVETATVPVTKPSYFGWLDLVKDGGTEPIAGRIIEVPENPETLFLPDPHKGLIDYVPPGSLARGAALVNSGGPGGQPCRSCHGAALTGGAGSGPVPAPPLAGRSAAYLARMLWDIKTGARSGPSVAQMQGPARGLSEAQITDIVAYLASLPP